MFGIGGDKGQKLVGAKEKRLRAALIKSGKNPDEITSKREGRQTDNTLVGVLIIYFLSCGLAWFLSTGLWKSGAPFDTGIGFIDDLMLSANGPAVFGDRDMDFVVLVLLRGLFLFAAAGIAPGLAWFWARLTDNPRLNIYRTCWGVPVGAGFVFFLFMEGVLPLLEEVFEIFAG